MQQSHVAQLTAFMSEKFGHFAVASDELESPSRYAVAFQWDQPEPIDEPHLQAIADGFTQTIDIMRGRFPDRRVAGTYAVTQKDGAAVVEMMIGTVAVAGSM